MKKLDLCIMALAMSIAMSAATRSVEEAAYLATQFASRQSLQSHMRRAPRKATDMQLAHLVSKPGSNEAAIYIFNQADNGGFVIVSADDNAVTILGYSDKGAFDSNHIPSNVQFWLDYQAERVAKAKPIDNGIRRAPHEQKETTPIAPLLGKIEWGQEFPYNALCPIDMLDGTRCYSGCLATAVAQMMRYWQWPEQGIGSHKYKWYNCTSKKQNGDCQQYHDTILSADFSATTYDWDNMLKQYKGKETDAQNHAVAELMYHIGVASDMEYGGRKAKGSSGKVPEMFSAFIRHFAYKKTAKRMWMDEKTTYEDIAYALKEDLHAGRPIFVTGYGDGYDYQLGHVFVCDGIDANDLFHFNWGWEGSYNGYYALTALDPMRHSTEEGSGFSAFIECFIGIEPEYDLGDINESMDAVQTGQSEIQKIIEDGQVIIVRGKNKFSVLGQKIQ